MTKTADIILTGFDGEGVCFYNVTHMNVNVAFDKLGQHLTPLEIEHREQAESQGYSELNQLIFALTATSAPRTHELMMLVTK